MLVAIKSTLLRVVDISDIIEEPPPPIPIILIFVLEVDFSIGEKLELLSFGLFFDLFLFFLVSIFKMLS